MSKLFLFLLTITGILTIYLREVNGNDLGVLLFLVVLLVYVVYTMIMEVNE